MKLLRAIFNRRRPIPFDPFVERPRLGMHPLEVASSLRPTREVLGTPKLPPVDKTALRATDIAGGLDPQRSDPRG